ncbi:hypothetical protein JCM11641_001209 [Rhodosporidiobolus odoratus]
MPSDPRLARATSASDLLAASNTPPMWRLMQAVDEDNCLVKVRQTDLRLRNPSNETLTSRLHSLGYSLDLPPPPRTLTNGKKQGSLLKFVERVERHIRTGEARQRLLEGRFELQSEGEDEEECGEDEEEEDSDSDRASTPCPSPRIRSAPPPPSSSTKQKAKKKTNPKDLTLFELVDLVERHKVEALEKKAEVGRAKGVSVETPRRGLGELRIDEGKGKAPPPTSPQKRRRAAPPPLASIPTSTPNSRSRASSPASTSSALPPSESPSPSASPSKRHRGPRKNSKSKKKKEKNIRLPSTTQLLAMAMRISSAHAASPDPSHPLLESVARLIYYAPDLTLNSLVDLAISIRTAQPLLSTASERAIVTDRDLGASFNLLGKTLFSPSSTSSSSDPLPFSPKPPLAALTLSRELSLYPCAHTSYSDFTPAIPSSISETPLRILSTRHTNCIQCATPLGLRSRSGTANARGTAAGAGAGAEDKAYLVDVGAPAFPALVAIHTCPTCRAIHAPDHVELVVSPSASSNEDNIKVWVWDERAEQVKVGERTWVVRGFMESQWRMCLEQGVGTGGWMGWWNGLFAETPVGEAEEEEEGEDNEDEEEDPFSAPTPRTRKTAGRPKNQRSKHFRLTQAQVWRSFVLFSSFVALRSSLHQQLITLARPSTEDLVQFVNRELYGSSHDGGGEKGVAVGKANVLGEHRCDVCTKERRVWRNQREATESERKARIQYAGTHAKDPNAQDTVSVDGPPVSLAVCDGIQIGHPLCAHPHCTNPPTAHRRAQRFCPTHIDLHDLCGIFSCGRLRSEELDSQGELTEACDNSEHQRLWSDFERNRREFRAAGWVGRKRRKGGAYGVRDVEVEEGRREKDWLDVDDSDDEFVLDEGEKEEEEEQPVGMEKIVTTWSLRRTSNLQILVSACGTPLAWSKFSAYESETEVISFLSSSHSQLPLGSFPSYIAYDRACHILRHAVSSSTPSSSSSFRKNFPKVLDQSRLIVTAFHRRSHPKDDEFCDEFCDPAPLDQRGMGLVVPFLRKKDVRGKKNRDGREAERSFERAFNTTAAEQLNSTLSRFAPLLSTMRADNFDFLVNVLLRYRREKVQQNH